jgi:methionine-rich copper-binding protein CopC
MIRHLTRTGATLALALTLLATVGVAGALAHVSVVSSNPARNSAAKHGPSVVRVLFSGPIRGGGLKVVAANGKVVSAPGGGRDPRNINRLAVGLRGRLSSGSYTVRWNVQAADGHSEAGSFRFRVR